MNLGGLLVGLLDLLNPRPWYLWSAFVWGAGALFLLAPWFKGLVVFAMIVAFCVALWLVYLTSRGSQRARRVLLLGVIVSVSAGAVRTLWGPPFSP